MPYLCFLDLAIGFVLGVFWTIWIQGEVVQAGTYDNAVEALKNLDGLLIQARKQRDAARVEAEEFKRVARLAVEEGTDLKKLLAESRDLCGQCAGIIKAKTLRNASLDRQLAEILKERATLVDGFRKILETVEASTHGFDLRAQVDEHGQVTQASR